MSKSERFWNRMAKQYGAEVGEDDQEALRTLDQTRKYLQADDLVLDYGCATGKFSFEIAPLVKEVRGIDISSEMIKEAERNAQERGLNNLQFIQGEIVSG